MVIIKKSRSVFLLLKTQYYLSHVMACLLGVLNISLLSSSLEIVGVFRLHSKIKWDIFCLDIKLCVLRVSSFRVNTPEDLITVISTYVNLQKLFVFFSQYTWHKTTASRHLLYLMYILSLSEKFCNIQLSSIEDCVIMQIPEQQNKQEVFFILYK